MYDIANPAMNDLRLNKSYGSSLKRIKEKKKKKIPRMGFKPTTFRLEV